MATGLVSAVVGAFDPLSVAVLLVIGLAIGLKTQGYDIRVHKGFWAVELVLIVVSGGYTFLVISPETGLQSLTDMVTGAIFTGLVIKGILMSVLN
ncbi:hypothetical protein G3I44_14380 [Halogeometricum borinquense]|uniref:Uncharacterized protein n=1 Tax=Halogeometricum borinquense TaxID=60847 RepID=A0A6C0ULA4_9EURY|nr:hypothetical protein [Halogeometricum borinquense]QIB75373.1 hypothetical protein G3I44_14380 [Halogeometricum borinquense]